MIFSETIVKDIKVHGEDWPSKLTAASHKNIVTFQQALYHNYVIYIFYEVLDVLLAQVFAIPLGQLKAYKIAAFCQGAGSGTDILGIDERVKLQVRLSTDT